MAELTSVHRVIRILELLSMGRCLTSSELNREFDEKVSLRTLQRDMITIQRCDRYAIGTDIAPDQAVVGKFVGTDIDRSDADLAALIGHRCTATVAGIDGDAA